MKIVIDTNILIQLMAEGQCDPLTDPKTDQTLDSCDRRALALLEYIESKNGQVLIPAPCLAEILIGFAKEDHVEVVEHLSSYGCIEFAPFEEIAATECAALINPAELKQMKNGDTKSKLRFDRQIISIAKASGADEIWSHDKNLLAVAEQQGLTVKSLADITPKPEQMHLDSEEGGA